MAVEWSANWDDDLGGRPEHAVPRRDAQGHRGQGEVRVRADLHVLPAADLRALPQPLVRSLVPVAVRSTSATRTASSSSTRTAAAAGACASPAARTRRSTSTTRPARPRSAPSATPASRSASRPCARRRASVGCATSAWCCTTPTGCSRLRASRTSTTSTTAQRSCFLDPDDPQVQRAAEAGRDSRRLDRGRAQRSPVWALINRYQVALPLHPEYRTMPMVWYIPPLSPVVDVVRDTGDDAEDRGNLFAAIEALRIPVEYLANLFTAGDAAPVEGVLRKLAAMRSYMRDINLGRRPRRVIPAAVGMSDEDDVRRCSGCSPSPSTTSGTSSRPRTPSRRTRSRSWPPSARSASTAAARHDALRRGLGVPDPGRRRELPDAAEPADL